jgi:hypothetical protein
MERHERALIEASLNCAAPSLLLYGMSSPALATAAALAALSGDVETLDLRQDLAEGRLRSELRSAFHRAPTVLVVIAGPPSETVCAVADEVRRGELKVDGDVEKIASGARLVVFTDALSCGPGRRCFGIQIAGMRVLERERAEVAAAAAELARRQERARRSSREHGLT